jgi:protocatechuate 3,4-dioxygenase beta subunit
MRVAAALVLLALAAKAEDMVVRVTVDDEPFEGASVQVQEAGNEGPTFRADKFAPDARTDTTGQALVQATPKDFVLVYVPGYELAVVEGGGQLADVALRPERVFSGRVVDTKGDPIAGASVLLRTTFRRKAEFSVATGENGRFHVYGLWFDNYRLRVEADGFLGMHGALPLTEQDSGETITLERPATIAGTVLDHRGEAVPGAEVRLGLGPTTNTDDKGTYRLIGLPHGVEFRVGFPPPWGGRSGPITLKEGEVLEGVDLVRLAPVTLRLRVVDIDGRGMEGVTVRRYLGLPDVATDATGSIEMHLPAEREGRITLIAAEHEDTTVRFERWRPGATQDLGDVTLRALPEIEVRVRRPDGTPAEGTVGDIPLVDGIARVKGADRYDLAVPGYPPTPWDVEPPGPVLITLPVRHWIEGVVLDTNGGPVAGAEIDAFHEAVETVRADDEGRFRIGPFVGGPVAVEASTATARSRAVDVVLGAGELELTVIATRADLLRGRVLRGIRPVPRFLIGGTRVVDEEGRFEVLIRRSEKDWIEVDVEDGDAHPFLLPPEGQELIARLPAGQVSVALEGAAPFTTVSLLAVGGVASDASSETGQDGIARFRDLEPGAYAAEATGFATTEFTLAAGSARLITLPATPKGTLTVRAPPGFQFPDEELYRTLNPGVHRDVLVGSGAYRIHLAAVRIVAGEETIVDLAPSDGRSLLIRGPPGTRGQRLLKQADATLRFVAQLSDKAGTMRFPVLPRGSYAVSTPLRRLTVDIVAGDTATVDLGRGAHLVADRVLLWNGKPAQGAEVQLFPTDDENRRPADDEPRTRSALTDLRGRFRFTNVFAGEYTCVADLAAHVPARGTVTVGVDGIVTDGLPLTLVRSAHEHARLLGLAGEPMEQVPIRVNGHWQTTDVLGRLRLHTVPARIDLDCEGLASLRDLEVHAGDDIRLVRGASLVVLSDPAAGPPVVHVGGRPWRRLEPGLLADRKVPGRLVLEDLPPGPVEIQLPAPPPAEGEDEPPEPPEPVVADLESGAETTVDLRPR